MAATATPINGTEIIVQISEDSGSTYDTVGFCTSASLSYTMDARDITSKDSAGTRNIASGKDQASISFEGFVTYSSSADVDKPNNIFDLMKAKTEVRLRYGNLNTGDYVYTADGLFTSFSLESGTEDNHTFNVNFEVDGDVTCAAYA